MGIVPQAEALRPGSGHAWGMRKIEYVLTCGDGISPLRNLLVNYHHPGVPTFLLER